MSNLDVKTKRDSTLGLFLAGDDNNWNNDDNDNCATTYLEFWASGQFPSIWNCGLLQC